jgi:hypothetical protein
MKKLLTILLAAALCLSCFVFAMPRASALAQDETNKAAAVLNMMDGSFRPDSVLTRAQFCKIAIVVMGHSAKVPQYAGYTIFPDVLSTDWEAGYVNAAVRYAGIMSGYADGTFRPDELVTYAQAVTVLVRMLGYTDGDVGARWPDGYMEKAEELGLTEGLSLPSGGSLTKGQMAVLFARLLNTEANGSAQTFMETMPGVSVIKNVFLVSANAETDTGAAGAVKIAGASGGTYLPVTGVPDALLGTYGSLILNSAGKALTFVPAESGTTVVSTVKTAEAGYIECANGMQISMTSSTVLYLDGETASYATEWSNISSGMRVSAYYSEGGTAAFVLITSASSAAESVIVVTSDTYSLPAGASVYINGLEASAADVIKYDVIEYDEDFNVYNVTRKHITGRYESALPNASRPDSVQVLGVEFGLLESAVSSAMKYDIGDMVMLLLTSDNKVADVVSLYGTNINYGVVKSVSSASATVELLNGITVSGTLEDDDSDYIAGQLVGVVSGTTGSVNLVGFTQTNYYKSLNIKDGTFGSYTLSNVIHIFDCVGDSMAEISLSDIPTNIVGASDVLYIAFDWSDKINLMILGDVTGDAYTYGFIKNSEVTQSSGGMSASNAATSVTNSDGTTEAVIGSTGLNNNAVAGIARTGDGYLAGFVTLASITGISRDDFEESSDGTMYVRTDKGLFRVSDDVQVFLNDTSGWTTLENARAVSDNLTVYYDRTLSTGGKIRFIIVY